GLDLRLAPALNRAWRADSAGFNATGARLFVAYAGGIEFRKGISAPREENGTAQFTLVPQQLDGSPHGLVVSGGRPLLAVVLGAGGRRVRPVDYGQPTDLRRVKPPLLKDHPAAAAPLALPPA